MTYDVIILGGGPGGYVAAIRGGQLGKRVCLVEDRDLGGTCLNRGCIPSKAYYESARRMAAVAEGARFGVRASLEDFDLAACRQRKDAVVEKLVGGVEGLLKGNGVDLVRGRGRLADADRVTVEGADVSAQEVTGHRVIVATGSRPARIPGVEVDGSRVVTSDEIWSLETLPQRLVVIGGGVIGCETAHIFASFGARVVILEALDRILASEDRDVSRVVHKALERKGVEVRTGVRVASAAAADAEVRVALEGDDEFACDVVAVAVGRTANSDDLGLEELGVARDGAGRIEVDDEMQTGVPGVYAVGDVVGRFMLAHVASAEGLVAVHNALGQQYWMDYGAVPYAVFTAPEVAGVGRRESQLKDQGVPYSVGRFAFAANGKALCMGETEGFVKLLSHADTGQLLGASIVGPHASDVIGELALGLRMAANHGDLVSTIHVHPTVSEAVAEAGEDIAGLAIHKLGRRLARKG